MKRVIARAAKSMLNRIGLEVRRIKPESVPTYSNLDEERIIAEYLSRVAPKNRFCVDIAAGDGVKMSNTYRLFTEGFGGLAAEYDGEKFSKLAYTYRVLANVSLCKNKVTPVNVVTLLRAYGAPRDFDVLSLDVDGYDFYILASILRFFRPRLLCVEINEKIPPPLRFTVKWDPSYQWAEDHFYGQSLAQLYTLATKHRYALVKLHYNNAFLIPREIYKDRGLRPEEAYTVGYKDREDRKVKFPWNENMEMLLLCSPQEGVRFLNQFFAKYKGKYLLTM